MKQLSLSKQILLTLLKGVEAVGREYRTMKRDSPFRMPARTPNYYVTLARLRQKGYVKRKGSHYTLTPPGQQVAHELLTRLPLKRKTKPWDGQWRMACFDIPERLRRERAALRSFLYRSGFRKLQESVWLTPYDILEEAERTWRELGLTAYVRTALVRQLDNEAEFKRTFKLS